MSELSSPTQSNRPNHEQPDCPCGNRKPYNECCEPFHNSSSRPATAEQLMRSRYCAYVQHNADYLLHTLHPTKRYAESHVAIEASFGQLEWQGLQISAKTLGSTQDTEGTVTFAAHYQDKQQNKVGVLYERSRFVKEDGQWYYVDGEHKIGRNEPCWCGSGKKYKKCHG